MKRVVAVMVCAGCGYAGGVLLQAGRPILAVCTWVVAWFVATVWIVGGMVGDHRLPDPLARTVCFLQGHYAPTKRPGWSWQRCRTCGRSVCVFRRPA